MDDDGCWPAKQSILASHTGIGNRTPELGKNPCILPTLPPLDCIAQRRLWGNWEMDSQAYAFHLMGMLPRIQLGSSLPDCWGEVCILLRPPPLLTSLPVRQDGGSLSAATAAESLLLISSKEWYHRPSSASDRSEVELRIDRRFFRIGRLRRQSGHPQVTSRLNLKPFSNSFCAARKIAIFFVLHKQYHSAIYHTQRARGGENFLRCYALSSCVIGKKKLLHFVSLIYINWIRAFLARPKRLSGQGLHSETQSESQLDIFISIIFYTQN